MTVPLLSISAMRDEDERKINQLMTAKGVGHSQASTLYKKQEENWGKKATIVFCLWLSISLGLPVVLIGNAVVQEVAGRISRTVTTK